MYHHRNISERIIEALGDTPVVLVNGPRQSGKSTLVRHLADTVLGARYVTLDEATVLAAAADDPGGFLRGLGDPTVIDEVQRVPELLLAIKAEVDRDRRPGRFLLSGSANALSMPQVSDSLAGRMEIHRLWPLSEGELVANRASFIDRVFSGDVPVCEGRLTRSDLLDRALRGGFPEALARAVAGRRQAWFESYLTTVVGRDIRDLASIDGLSNIPRLLQVLAARSGGLLNQSDVACDVGLNTRTLGRYLALLQAIFLVETLPAWSRNVSRRLAKSPKLLLTDTGLMAHLLRIGSPSEAERDAGALLETFVAMELRKQTGWSEARIDLYHYRTHSGREVDLVLQRGNGAVVAVEVKCASAVSSGDFAGIRDLADAVGSDLLCGIVLHTGTSSTPFGDRLYALPVESLWAAGQ